MDYDLSNYPYNQVDDKLEVSPTGIIQLSLSRMRESRCSDYELAKYIADFLGMMMYKNKLIIDTEDIIRIKFKSKKSE